ncbi:MAG: DUF4012 domain-containing protein [Patescibacteria group bacterium]
MQEIKRPKKNRYDEFLKKKVEKPVVQRESFVAPKNIVSGPKILLPSKEDLLESEIFPADINLLNKQVVAKYPKLSVIQKETLVFGVLALLCFVSLKSASIVASGIQTRSQVIGTAKQALSQLKEAQVLASEKDFVGVQKQLEFAQNNFEQARKDISSLGGLVSSAIKILPEGQAAQNLLEAGAELSASGIALNNFYAMTSQIQVSENGFSSPDGLYQTLNATKKYLNDAEDGIKKATENLSKVDSKYLPEDLRDQFVNYKNNLEQGSVALSQISSILNLFQQFLGPGSKTLLVLFENNNELRATGGFIGTYGFFKLNNGKIESQKISSVYDLDGQILEKIAPPGPFHDLTDSWGLRDSNWFVDFKESALKAISFYEKAGKQTPDAVVAMTPDMFVDLLSVLGPIDLPKYNVSLNANNFREQVQLNTSIGYNKKENKPKQILSDFAPLLLQKISLATPEQKSELLGILFSSLSKKNLMFYDRNKNVQEIFESYSWAGRILDTDRDYLAIYNTNLGGRKTDLSIQQSAVLNSEVQEDGSIVNTITYTRKHQLNLYEQAKNIDYVRFLVPKGSKFVSAQGFVKKPYYKSDGSGYTANLIDALKNQFKKDSDLLKYDSVSKVVDQTSGTVEGIEAGKTYFANWIEVLPGEEAVVTLKYRLPFNLDDSRKYSLLLQKQPGANPLKIDYSLKTNAKVLWYTGNLKNSLGKINYNSSLSEDTFLGLVLEGR